MTKLLFAIVFLSASAAFGQAGSISSQAQAIEFPDHPQHASLTAMACEHPLVGGASDNYTYAKGEVPLWEFGPVSQPVPLGDIARAYRKEKQAAKKAEIILEKQGS
jgi:hypothetical protein